jgi:hypothetical protein
VHCDVAHIPSHSKTLASAVSRQGTEAMNERLRHEFERIEARIEAHLRRIRDHAEEVQRIVKEHDRGRPPELSAQ